MSASQWNVFLSNKPKQNDQEIGKITTTSQEKKEIINKFGHLKQNTKRLFPNLSKIGKDYIPCKKRKLSPVKIKDIIYKYRQNINSRDYCRAFTIEKKKLNFMKTDHCQSSDKTYEINHNHTLSEDIQRSRDTCNSETVSELKGALYTSDGVSQKAKLSRHTPATSGTELSRPTPATSGTELSRPTPATSGTELSRPTPATSDTELSRPTPATSGTELSRPTPATSGTELSRPTPATSGTELSRPTPATSGTELSRPTPATSGTELSRPTPATSDTELSRPTPATSGTELSRPTPATSGTELSRPTPATSGTELSRPTPATSGTELSRPTPATSDTELSTPTPATSGDGMLVIKHLRRDALVNYCAKEVKVNNVVKHDSDVKDIDVKNMGPVKKSINCSTVLYQRNFSTEKINIKDTNLDCPVVKKNSSASEGYSIFDYQTSGNVSSGIASTGIKKYCGPRKLQAINTCHLQLLSNVSDVCSPSANVLVESTNTIDQNKTPNAQVTMAVKETTKINENLLDMNNSLELLHPNLLVPSVTATDEDENAFDTRVIDSNKQLDESTIQRILAKYADIIPQAIKYLSQCQNLNAVKSTQAVTITPLRETSGVANKILPRYGMYPNFLEQPKYEVDVVTSSNSFSISPVIPPVASHRHENSDYDSVSVVSGISSSVTNISVNATAGDVVSDKEEYSNESSGTDDEDSNRNLQYIHVTKKNVGITNYKPAVIQVSSESAVASSCGTTRRYTVSVIPVTKQERQSPVKDLTDDFIEERSTSCGFLPMEKAIVAPKISQKLDKSSLINIPSQIKNEQILRKSTESSSNIQNLIQPILGQLQSFLNKSESSQHITQASYIMNDCIKPFTSNSATAASAISTTNTVSDMEPVLLQIPIQMNTQSKTNCHLQVDQPSEKSSTVHCGKLMNHNKGNSNSHDRINSRMSEDDESHGAAVCTSSTVRQTGKSMSQKMGYRPRKFSANCNPLHAPLNAVDAQLETFPDIASSSDTIIKTSIISNFSGGKSSRAFVKVEDSAANVVLEKSQPVSPLACNMGFLPNKFNSVPQSGKTSLSPNVSTANSESLAYTAALPTVLSNPMLHANGASTCFSPASKPVSNTVSSTMQESPNQNAPSTQQTFLFQPAYTPGSERPPLLLIRANSAQDIQNLLLTKKLIIKTNVSCVPPTDGLPELTNTVSSTQNTPSSASVVSVSSLCSVTSSEGTQKSIDCVSEVTFGGKLNLKITGKGTFISNKIEQRNGKMFMLKKAIVILKPEDIVNLRGKCSIKLSNYFKCRSRFLAKMSWKSFSKPCNFKCKSKPFFPSVHQRSAVTPSGVTSKLPIMKAIQFNQEYPISQGAVEKSNRLSQSFSGNSCEPSTSYSNVYPIILPASADIKVESGTENNRSANSKDSLLHVNSTNAITVTPDMTSYYLPLMDIKSEPVEEDFQDPQEDPLSIEFNREESKPNLSSFEIVLNQGFGNGRSADHPSSAKCKKNSGTHLTTSVHAMDKQAKTSCATPNISSNLHVKSELHDIKTEDSAGVSTDSNGSVTGNHDSLLLSDEELRNSCSVQPHSSGSSCPVTSADTAPCSVPRRFSILSTPDASAVIADNVLYGPVYMDANATTPLAPEVADTINKTMRSCWGNPSSAHKYGEEARTVIQQARTQVASMLSARHENIIFTSGGTEANNLAIHSAIKHYRNWVTCSAPDGHCLHNTFQRPHVITSNLEHDSVRRVLDCYEDVDVTVVHWEHMPDKVISSIKVNTCLITIMLANNETGIMLPVGHITRLLTDVHKMREAERLFRVLVHTDASQCVGKVPVEVDDLNVDYLTLTGHKFYGPRIGALYVRENSHGFLPVYPLLYGGGQERGIRPGTENTPLIAGLGAACELVRDNLYTYAANFKKMRAYLERAFKRNFGNNIKVNCISPCLPDAKACSITYRSSASSSQLIYPRLPNTYSVAFNYPQVTSALLLKLCPMLLCSVGAACHADQDIAYENSILQHHGVCEFHAARTLRLSLGRDTTQHDVDAVMFQLKRACVLLVQGRVIRRMGNL